jgi:hypothetical protein
LPVKKSYLINISRCQYETNNTQHKTILILSAGTVNNARYSYSLGFIK